MCAPITHLLLASKLKEKYFQDVDALAYYSGTLYPDIRYYVGMPKDFTHRLWVKISELAHVSDWYKGFWVHSLVDQVHAAYMISRDPERMGIKPGYLAYILLEDHIFYPEVEGLVDLEKLETQDFSEELDFVGDATKIREYRHYNAKYLSERPSFNTQIEFLEIITPQIKEEGHKDLIKENFAQITNEKAVKDIESFVEDFFDEITSGGFV